VRKTLPVIAACLLGIVFFCIGLSEEVRAGAGVEKQLIAYGRYISQIAGCKVGSCKCLSNTKKGGNK